jgi:transcriptional regulator with XRE-family HTH domain
MSAYDAGMQEPVLETAAAKTTNAEPLTLRQWRQRRVLGTAELATLAGVTKPTIIAIEHGRVRAIKHRTIRKLSAALGVEPAEVAEFRRVLMEPAEE